jgi:hypothetical protein
MDTRLKIRYSLAETQNNLYTFGGEWQTTDGVEYRGAYHQYTVTQETFTEPEWLPGKSRQLIALQRISPLIAAYNQLATPETAYQSVQPIQPEITEQNKTDGFVMRYFIKKINDINIIEISKDQYTAYQNNEIDNNMYTVGAIRWQIAGPIESQTTPYQKPGVVELNETAIMSLKKTMSGIDVKLSNLTEYYTDTDFMVPKNIN